MNKEIPAQLAECYQELFNLMCDQHDVILLVSELDEIIKCAARTKEKLDKFYLETDLN